LIEVIKFEFMLIKVVSGICLLLLKVRDLSRFEPHNLNLPFQSKNNLRYGTHHQHHTYSQKHSTVISSC
jgi:hypothetical protein